MSMVKISRKFAPFWGAGHLFYNGLPSTLLCPSIRLRWPLRQHHRSCQLWMRCWTCETRTKPDTHLGNAVQQLGSELVASTACLSCPSMSHVASKSPSCLGQAHFSHENGQATSLAERSGYWISYTESDIAAYVFNSYEVMNNYDMIHGDFCRAFPACQNLAVQSIATGLATS